MHFFIWIALKTVLSNIALGNPIPEDLPIDSDFLSENTIAFNDFETSSPIPLELTTQTPDASDPTSLQPLDSSAPPPDTIQLFADSTDTPLQTSLFAESSNGLPENSCEAAGGDFQPYSKRDDGQSCTPKARVDPLPLLSLPDLDNLEEVVGSGQGETQKRRAFNIPPIPGYTVDDDKFCPTPKRRLCCQGPPSTTFVQVWEIVNDCRDFGPWPCPARYDVCCQYWVNLEFSDLRLAATGFRCTLINENPNGIEWEGGAGQAPPL